MSKKEQDTPVNAVESPTADEVRESLQASLQREVALREALRRVSGALVELAGQINKVMG